MLPQPIDADVFVFLDFNGCTDTYRAISKICIIETFLRLFVILIFLLFG